MAMNETPEMSYVSRTVISRQSGQFLESWFFNYLKKNMIKTNFKKLDKTFYGKIIDDLEFWPIEFGVFFKCMYSYNISVLNLSIKIIMKLVQKINRSNLISKCE